MSNVQAIVKKPLTEDEIKEQRKVWDKIDTKIQYEGRVIMLPAHPHNMPLDKAIEALQRLQKDEEQPYQVHEIFDAYPHDAAVAFVKAMQKLYGFASFETERTFFGPEHPQMLSIKTGIGANDFVLVPMGQLRLPGVKDPIKTQFWRKDRNGPTVFLVHGTVKKKDRHIVLELANEARQILKTESIYRGKPLRIKVGDDGELDMTNPPEFLDVREIREEHLFFDQDVHDQITTSILVPIRHSDECRRRGIQAKRTVVLSGPFGTGKSLTGRLVAKEGEDNGWTYILLDKVQGLKAALEFAGRYAPAIVFAEDVERAAGTARTDQVNELINIVDGVVSKTSQVMTVLTTNYLEQINRAMLRPGRLDAVIAIRAPGPKTAERIIRFYAGNLLAEGADLTGAGLQLKGQIPATIREAVDRAKLGMIGRRDTKLVDHDIVIAGQTMQTQLDALNNEAKPESSAEALARSLSDVVNGNADGRLKTMQQTIEEIHNHVS